MYPLSMILSGLQSRNNPRPGFVAPVLRLTIVELWVRAETKNCLDSLHGTVV